MAKVLAKAKKYINGEEALISKKKEALQPIKRKAGPISDRDGAQEDKVT